jgi:uncharacterized protein YdhG (YjbR/CyaY superfamily)
MPKAYAARGVEQYLSLVPPFQGDALATVRRTLLALIPDVSESFSYQLILFRSHGRALVGLSAARFDCSLHLMSPDLARELARVGPPEGRISGAALQFATGRPLTEPTLALVVQRRLAELAESEAHHHGSHSAVA